MMVANDKVAVNDVEFLEPGRRNPGRFSIVGDLQWSSKHNAKIEVI
jgi:hypothetical protein